MYPDKHDPRATKRQKKGKSSKIQAQDSRSYPAYLFHTH